MPSQGREAERSFVQRVRNGEIRQPTQKSFSPRKWQQAFNKITSPTLEDSRLYEAGVWAFNKLEAIIWKRFFEGEYYQMVTTTDSGQLEAQSVFKLYSDERDAAKNIVKYLADPPQLAHYKQFITARIHQYPKVDKDDRGLAVAVLEVVLPIPNLSL